MQKSITLLGMSGVGKTTLSRKLPREKWFHFSGDYRIATHYLKTPIGDFLTEQAMQAPLLADLLKSDSIFIGSNLTVDNLAPVSAYIGKLGQPALGGSDLDTFLERQQLHHDAEVATCYDLEYFKQRARTLYGYDHFLFDAGGSICELDNDNVLEYLAEHSDIVYIHADEALTEMITERALAYPKPLYYNRSFLMRQLSAFGKEHDIESVTDMVPDEFIRFVVPQLIKHRSERYLAIAERYGITIDARDALAVRDEADFLDLIQ